MKESIFLFDCALLVVVPCWFIVNSVYQDGVFGRTALCGIAFAAATFLMEAVNGEAAYVSPQMLLLVSAFAVFMVWHLLRFHRRVLRQRSGIHAPRAPADCPLMERDVFASQQQGDRSVLVNGPRHLK